jgi:hypothetical protein
MRKRHWRLKTKSLSKRNKSTNAKLQTLYGGSFSSTAYLLLFPVFNNTQSYETGIAQTKHSDYQITPSFIECRVKITLNEKNGKTTET